MQLQNGHPRALKFAPHVHTDFRLLEIPDESVLSEILQTGVVIKGDEHEEAVLCTCSKTYAIKYVETTNTQLLIQPQQGSSWAEECHSDNDENQPNNLLSPPGLQTQYHKWNNNTALPPVVVAATCKAHLELVETAPRLHALYRLLSERPYGLPAEEEDDMGEANPSSSGRYTFEELLQNVQASAEELRAALRDMHAVELGGHWRSVDATYLGSLLELVILSALQEGLPVSSIPIRVIINSLAPEGYIPEIIRHCLDVFGSRVTDHGDLRSGQEEHGGMWCLDETKVCVHFAVKLLARGALLAQEFLQAWGTSVPEGMSPRLDMLKGEALMEGKGPQARIKLFRVCQLPRSPAQRFAALFAERPKWEWPDLEPYLTDLKVPGQNIGALLLKYARSSQLSPSDPVIYSAR